MATVQGGARATPPRCPNCRSTNVVSVLPTSPEVLTYICRDCHVRWEIPTPARPPS